MKQLNKTFILTQFGEPHPWTQEYFRNVERLGKFGWNWMIFTPHKYDDVPENVKIIPMTIEEFNELVELKTGVNPQNYIKPDGVPSKHMSDFYVASGLIFEDFLTDVDYWGITNWDIVYGRLEYYFPDSLLQACDIFSDDVNTFNGIFSLMKNSEKINNLFKRIPSWESKFSIHELFATDEFDMTDIVRSSRDFTFLYPMYYPMHSHDRLEQHNPQIKLTMKDDGSLWELFLDVDGPKWEHARPLVGKEIPYFHFIRTKAWPNII